MTKPPRRPRYVRPEEIQRGHLRAQTTIAAISVAASVLTTCGVGAIAWFQLRQSTEQGNLESARSKNQYAIDLEYRSPNHPASRDGWYFPMALPSSGSITKTRGDSTIISYDAVQRVRLRTDQPGFFDPREFEGCVVDVSNYWEVSKDGTLSLTSDLNNIWSNQSYIAPNGKRVNIESDSAIVSIRYWDVFGNIQSDSMSVNGPDVSIIRHDRNTKSFQNPITFITIFNGEGLKVVSMFEEFKDQKCAGLMWTYAPSPLKAE